MASFTLAVTEGLLEQAVIAKLFNVLSIPQPTRFIAKGGKDRFWRDAPRYNRAAEHAGPILGLADLEGEPCPSALIGQHIPEGVHPLFVLRIAQRMLEAWILADRIAIAKFLRVGVGRIPTDPEAERDPKTALVNAARYSGNKAVREDLVPEPGASALVGRGYVSRVSEFVRHDWRPLDAQDFSRSLRRAIIAIRLRS